MSMIKAFTTRNVGTVDRIVRILPAIAVGIAWYSGWIAGGLAVILAIGAGMLLVTSLLGSCSIYYMLGFSTCPISGKRKAQKR